MLFQISQFLVLYIQLTPKLQFKCHIYFRKIPKSNPHFKNKILPTSEDLMHFTCIFLMELASVFFALLCIYVILFPLFYC